MTTLDDLRIAATEQAAALDADFVGAEHLFLAWLLNATGPVAETIAAAGLTPDTFRELLAKSPQRPKRGTVSPEPGSLSSQAQRIMDASTQLASVAGREAATLDDAIVAMIREPRGAIARALSTFSLKPSKVLAPLRDLVALIEPRQQKVAPPREETAPAEGAAAAPPKQEPRAPRPERAPKAERQPRREEPPRPAARTPEPRKPKRDPEIDDIPESRPPVRPKLVPPPKPAALPQRERSWSVGMLLYLAFPIAIYLRQSGASAIAIFVASCVAILPLAKLMGTATEYLAERTGPTVGGLLNATFGNAAELIIALFALKAGYIELVKASITGSILGNLLLVLGLALVAGGMRRPLLTFNRTAAGMSAAMLALAVSALILPALFHASMPTQAVSELPLSEMVAGILIITYLASLVFSLRTHRSVFGGEAMPQSGDGWGIGKSLGVLALATAGVAVASEILVGSIEAVTHSLGISQTFLGLIVIPVIGNAAEHATAIVVARKGQMDLALQIAVGSSTQVALLVAPVLVFAGFFLGAPGMTLVFTAFEVAALGMAVVVSAFITLDGESHWFEGVQLLALYAMIAAAAWFI